MTNSCNERGLPRISLPIIVEGRYDKSAICGMLDATVVTTDGFGIFNSKEKQALIKRLSENGIILLTDSDGGGKQIRSFLAGLIPKEKIYHVYIPEIKGREKRKTRSSAAGLLGVEGVGGEVLLAALSPYIDNALPKREEISTSQLFSLGLSGGENSQAKRDEIAIELGLPRGMSAKAFAEAVRLVSSYGELLSLSGNGD